MTLAWELENDASGPVYFSFPNTSLRASFSFPLAFAPYLAKRGREFDKEELLLCFLVHALLLVVAHTVLRYLNITLGKVK